MSKTHRFSYPVELVAEDEGGYTVLFPDIPEAVTQGEDKEEALLRAVDALETALEFYTEDGRDLPTPSKPRRRPTVSPSMQSSIKLALYQEMKDQGVRKSELARRLGWHMPQVDRLLDLHHRSKLEQAEAAVAALGCRANIEIGRAA